MPNWHQHFTLTMGCDDDILYPKHFINISRVEMLDILCLFRFQYAGYCCRFAFIFHRFGFHVQIEIIFTLQLYVHKQTTMYKCLYINTAVIWRANFSHFGTCKKRAKISTSCQELQKHEKPLRKFHNRWKQIRLIGCYKFEKNQSDNK